MSAERIGRFVLGSADYGLGLYRLFVNVALRTGALSLPPVRAVFYKQIYFTGVEALGAVGFIAALSGIVVVNQAVSVIGADATLTAKIMLWTVVRELAPLLGAIVIVARSSSAAAAELASMKIRGELNNLRILGIDPVDYLVVPRIAGIAVSAVAITYYFQVIAIVWGFAFATAVHDLSFVKNLAGISAILTLGEIAASLVKGLAFGLVISATACHYGLRARQSVTAVPRAATRTVMSNLIAVFLLDGVISYLFFV